MCIVQYRGYTDVYVPMVILYFIYTQYIFVLAFKPSILYEYEYMTLSYDMHIQYEQMDIASDSNDLKDFLFDIFIVAFVLIHFFHVS